MAVNYSTIAEKIMRFIQGNGLSLKMYNSDNGKSVANPEEARFFYIEEPNMMVTIDEASKEVKLHFGEGVDIDKPKAEKLMNSLRNLSREYMLDFDVRSFGRHIEPKNYAYKVEKNKEQTMSDVFNEGMSLFASFVMLLNFQRFGKMKGMGTIVEWSIRDETMHVQGNSKLFREFCEEHPRIVNDELKPQCTVTNTS